MRKVILFYTLWYSCSQNTLRAGIPKGINRITFFMYTQSKLIKKNILRAGIPKGINRIIVYTLWYSCYQNIFFY
jgi:hypothetical protein